jgi:hypothetical protein
MEKQRRSAAQAEVMHLVKPRWQANSRVTPQTLLSENCRTKVKLLVQQPAKLQFLEPQD